MMKRPFIVIFIGLLGVVVYIFFLADSPKQSPSITSSDSKSIPEFTSTIMESEVENDKVITQMDKTKESFSPEPSSPVTQPLLKNSVTFSEGQILSLTPEAVVTRRQPLSGSITDFDARQYYFLIIQSQHFGQLHYPQEELLSADWEVTGTYGSVNQKYGYRYDTFVVQTSQAEAAQIMTEAMRKRKGLAELPPDTMIITDKVTVVCCQ